MQLKLVGQFLFVLSVWTVQLRQDSSCRQNFQGELSAQHLKDIPSNLYVYFCTDIYTDKGTYLVIKVLKWMISV